MNYDDFRVLLSRVFPRSIQIQFREQPNGLIRLLHDRSPFIRAFYAPDGMADLPQLAAIAPDVAEAIDELKLLDPETFAGYLLQSTDSSAHQGMHYLESMDRKMLTAATERADVLQGHYNRAKQAVIELTEQLRISQSNYDWAESQYQKVQDSHDTIASQLGGAVKRLEQLRHKHSLAPNDRHDLRRAMTEFRIKAAKEYWAVLHEGAPAPLFGRSAILLGGTVKSESNDVCVQGLVLEENLLLHGFTLRIPFTYSGIWSDLLREEPASLERRDGITRQVAANSRDLYAKGSIKRKTLGLCVGFVSGQSVPTYSAALNARRKAKTSDEQYLLADRRFLNAGSPGLLSGDARVAYRTRNSLSLRIVLEPIECDAHFPPFWQDGLYDAT